MEFLDGSWKKEVSSWDALMGEELLNQEAILEGAIHSIRNMGDVAFVIIRRREGLFQTVFVNEDVDFSIHDLKEGMTVRVKGVVNKEERAPHGRELHIREIQVLSSPAEPLPLAIDKWKLNTSLEAKLNYRSLSLRNIQERARFKIQEALTRAFRDYLYENGFTEIHTPKIGARGAEGGANLFKLSYFHKPAVLAQSPQFYKQMMVGVFDRVFETGPVFRAEKHNTKRHLNEYTSLDFEMGFINDMYDVMNMETAMLRYLMDYLKENYANEIKILNADIPEITEIPAVKFEDAVTLIKGSKAKNKFDLEPEDEVFLCNWAKENYGTEFIFVTNFPSSKPPFYAMNDKEDPRTACKFDLLFRGLEITTGGQRIHDYNEQLEKMKAQGLDPEDFKSYLESHKYGLPPHGGLGIGLERLVMKLLGQANVRQASMFPRDMNRLLP